MTTALEKTFELQGDSITLKVAQDELFMPNATTKLFSRAVRIDSGDVVFDIGSGVGPLAIWAARRPSSRVYAVEIVPEQCELLRENVRSNGVESKVSIYEGRFFDPLPHDLRADVIIADVSGIAEGPARALGWYPPSIPTGGPNGTGVIIPMLEQSGRYLKPGGRLYFPVAIGLSDDEKIMDVARARFGKLELKESPNFPLTSDQLRDLDQYRSLPFFKLTEKGTRTVWEGRIYEATDPKTN